ncbi:hypothetical protein F4780DRAFT_734103 [Xylariomycetidae sp. FL0641]|nr:hypothetical protein F4780DRAFT_734103 [Xylariomycetidae sp. FL0641]
MAFQSFLFVCFAAVSESTRESGSPRLGRQLCSGSSDERSGQGKEKVGMPKDLLLRASGTNSARRREKIKEKADS